MSEKGEAAMRYRNGWIFTERGYVRGGLCVENGRFGSVTADAPEEPDAVDLGGMRVLPGLIDLHIHGGCGADVSDGEPAALLRMARFLLQNGVTSFVPTAVTLPSETLKHALAAVKTLRDSRPDGAARVLGARMEGPYLSERRKGAHNAAYLRKPDLEAFRRLYDDCGGIIRIVDVAPETEDAGSFIRAASWLCRVSVAHTDAEYSTASAAFDAGASQLTHLFNAMPPLLHREPGVIGAASERGVLAELIADGVHVHPSAVRAAFRLFPERVCLISDAIRCCGMPDGTYELGGQPVFLSDHAARLGDGTLAGSVITLWEGMTNAIRFGIPEDTAIRAASLRPAEAIGMADELGSIAPGKRADFVVCDEKYRIRSVFTNGLSQNICEQT